MLVPVGRPRPPADRRAGVDPRAPRGHPRGGPARRPVRRLDLSAVAAPAVDERDHRGERHAAEIERRSRRRRAGAARPGPAAARQPRRHPDPGRHRHAEPLARRRCLAGRADRAHPGPVPRGHRRERCSHRVLTRPPLVHVQRAGRALALEHDPCRALRHPRDRLPAVEDAEAGRDRRRPAGERQPERRQPRRRPGELEPARRSGCVPALVHLPGHRHAGDRAHRHARRLDDHRAGGQARIRRPVRQVGEERGPRAGRDARRGRRLERRGSRLVRPAPRSADRERSRGDGPHPRARGRTDGVTDQLRQQRLRVRRPARRFHQAVHVHAGRPRALRPRRC